MTKKIFLNLALILTLSACGSSTQGSDTSKIETVKSELEREVNLDIKENELLTLASNNNKIAFTLLKKLNGSNKGNIYFSPYSISRSLAKLHLGADIESREEIASVANFNMSDDSSFHKTFNTLDLWLNHSDSNYTFSSSNSIWLQKNTHISSLYLDSIKVNYGENIKTLNYNKEARSLINSWIKEDSKGRINTIIPKDEIDEHTKLVLADTAYFQNPWSYPFSKEKTQDDNFHLLDESTKKVPFMYQGGGCISYPYYKGDNYQVLSLRLASAGAVVEKDKKYKITSDTTMLLILPDKSKFDNILQDIESIYIESYNKLSEQEITVKIPKFSFMTPSYDIQRHLKDIGINQIFEDNKSLKRISTEENRKVDIMYHKSFISIDELGIESESLSQEIMTCEGFTDKIVHFYANRAFIFIIKDNRTEQILFIGVIRDPSI